MAIAIQRLLDEQPRLLGAPHFLQEHAEIARGTGDRCLVQVGHGAHAGKRITQQRLHLVHAAGVLQEQRQVVHRAHSVRRRAAVDAFVQLQAFAHGRLAFGRATKRLQAQRALMLHLGDHGFVTHARGADQFQRLVEQRQRLGGQTQLQARGTDRQRHARRLQRLPREGAVAQLLRRGIQCIAHADVLLSFRLPRIGRTQRFHKEVGHRARGQRLVARAPGADQADDGGRHQRDGSDHAGRHRKSMPSNEATRAIAKACRPRHHRATVEMAIDVLDEFGNARVTAMRLLFHAATHDRVQIVLQRLHQRFGRKTSAFGGFAGLRAIGLQPTLIAQRWALEARGFHHTVGAAHGVAIKRTRTGQQFAKDHAERPHIAAHLSLPRGLLGCHVGGRADQRLAHGGQAGQRIGAFHSLGDAEVDHARLHHIALDAHQHVGGLQVAVDHALLVRVQHALGGAAEQTQAFAKAKPFQIGMRRDGHARHQRHGEPRTTIFG